MTPPISDSVHTAIRALPGGPDLIERLSHEWGRILRDLRSVRWMSPEDAVHTAVAAHLDGRDGVTTLRSLLRRLGRHEGIVRRARELARGRGI